MLMLVYGSVRRKIMKMLLIKMLLMEMLLKMMLLMRMSLQRRLQERHWSRSCRSESLMKRIKDIRQGETNSGKLISEFYRRWYLDKLRNPGQSNGET